MGVLCPGHRKHVRLRGIVVVEGKAKWRTSFAAAYSPGFARRLAGILRNHAPDDASSSVPSIVDPWWQRRLAAASGHDISPAVGLTVLPQSHRLQWELATKQWGGDELVEDRRIFGEVLNHSSTLSRQL